MPTFIYTEQESGNLKLVAEIEEDLDDNEAVEALLAESPRIRADRFVVLVGTLEDGIMSVVEEAEEVITTTTWKSSRNGNGEAAAPAKKRGPGRPRKAVAEDDEAPAPRRRGRPPGSKNKASAAKPGPKAGTAKRRGRPPGSKNKVAGSARRKTGSGFKRNAASDE